jgi:hypothetical protein
MSDLLTIIQIVCVVLPAPGGPAYALLQRYWRMEAAERALRNERLKSSRLEREVQQLAADLAQARHNAGGRGSRSCVPAPASCRYGRNRTTIGTRLRRGAPLTIHQIDRLAGETSRKPGGFPPSLDHLTARAMPLPAKPTESLAYPRA